MSGEQFEESSDTRGTEETLRNYTNSLVMGMQFGGDKITEEQASLAQRALGKLDQLKDAEYSLGTEGVVAVRSFLTTISTGERPTADEIDRVTVELRK